MRAKILLLLLLSMPYCFAQQSWRPIGNEDSNKAACGRAGGLGRNPIIVKNDHIFFFNYQSQDNNTTGGNGISIAKYADNKWEHINFPFLYTATTPIDCAVNNAETIYLAMNDIWADGLPVVKKFENGNWANVGSGISGTATSLMNIEIGTDNKPWILYQEGNLIKLKKFDGTNWLLISESSEFLPYHTISFQLDKNDVPYIISNHSLSVYSCFVKKFNGTNWEEVGITGFPNAGKKLAFDNANNPYLAIGYQIKKFTGSDWENIPFTLRPNTGINTVENICFTNSNELYAGYLGFSRSGFSTTPGFFIQKLSGGSWQALSSSIFINDKAFTAFGDSMYLLSYEGSYYPEVKKYTGTQFTTLAGTPISSRSIASDSHSELYSEVFTHDFSVCNGIPIIARVNSVNKVSTLMYVNDNWTNLGAVAASENEIMKAAIKSGTDGKIYLAYNNRLSDMSNDFSTKLTVKQLTPTGWEALGPVNFSLTAGPHFDFKVSHANEPYVLYMSGRVQKFDGSNWVFVGGSAYLGDVTARLALDANDVPYIAYQDASNDYHITVKRLNAGIWEYVDQSGLATYTGRHFRPRIVIDRANNVYIGFADLSRRVHIKKLVNGQWQSVGPDFFTTAKTDQFEMAVDYNDVLFVSYNELENNFRSYAKVKKFNGTD